MSNAMKTAVPASKVSLHVPLNRVEGDLEIRVELCDGRVADAWSTGTMYRGFERIMVGRGALDGLVITPRVCGICGTAHLMAAVHALDEICGVQPPPHAVRVRNLALMAEHVQSDIRHGVLMFMADFVNPAYEPHPLYHEAVARYEPFKGRTVLETIKQTTSILELVAVLGGQWPHSSYMVPGGIATVPDVDAILSCRYLVSRFRDWYENRILGCPIQRWLEVQSAADLDAWLQESPSHLYSDLGFFLRFAREMNLDKIGRGHGNFITFGQLNIPRDSAVRGRSGQSDRLVSSGFARGTEVSLFDELEVTEHVAHSWFVDYEGGRHPMDGETCPDVPVAKGKKYSWTKAPRYAGFAAETGPLAEMVIGRNPLFTDIVGRDGPNVLVRELARLARPAELLPAMRQWLCEISPDGPFHVPTPPITDGQAFGATGASRGALGHWVKIADGKIEHYQIITPTAWNAAPRDSGGVRGPWEEALVDTPVKDMDNPVELGHVVRSFDACLVCAVHAVEGPHNLFRKTW